MEKVDPELRALAENEKGIPIYYTTIEYNSGLMHQSTEDILELDTQVTDFKKSRGEAVFIFFLGLVNHWVTVVVHR